MTDIVKRLRQGIKASKFNDWDFERTEADMEEGADEIEKLRAALREVMQETAEHHAENVSRAELGGSDMAQRKAKAIASRSGGLLYKIRFIARAALEVK